MRIAQKEVPNPGSEEARALGCKCPVLDNNHGKWAPWGDGGWWISGSCMVHARNTVTYHDDEDPE